MSAGVVVGLYLILLGGLAILGLAFALLLEPESMGRVGKNLGRRYRRDD